VDAEKESMNAVLEGSVLLLGALLAVSRPAATEQASALGAKSPPPARENHPLALS
jgi:hypothetical protein